MTLKEYMDDPKELAEGEYFHIGSAGSFVCIVTKEEFPDHILEWDDNIKMKLRDKIARNFADASAKEPWHETFSDTNIVMGYAMKPALDARFNIAEKATKQFEKTLQALYEFTPFEDREVIEVYDRLSKDGVVVSITGTENGQFWMRSEYEKWLETRNSKTSRMKEDGYND